MSTAPTRPMSLPEFLAWEERQELRWEFDGEQPVAMNGGTLRHGLIGGRIRRFLGEALDGHRCRVYGPDLKIEVLGGIRYPDAVVSCTCASPDAPIVPEPVVVIEVSSPGTASIHRLPKLREYQATPAIQRFVIVEQDSVAATVYNRHAGGWAVDVLTDGGIVMPEIGVSMPLAVAYQDVGPPTREPPDHASGPHASDFPGVRSGTRSC